MWWHIEMVVCEACLWPAMRHRVAFEVVCGFCDCTWKIIHNTKTT